jgi:hypothetical protein
MKSQVVVEKGLQKPSMKKIKIAENSINLEFIVGHGKNDETMGLIFGVKQNQIAAALGLLQGLKENFAPEEIRSRDGVGMIFLFPHGSRAAVIGIFLEVLVHRAPTSSLPRSRQFFLASLLPGRPLSTVSPTCWKKRRARCER